MSEITIPPEALEAAARGVLSAIMFEVEPDARASQLTNDEYRSIARAAIRAALAAWPMMKTENRETLNFGNNIDGPVVSAKRVPFIILPLTENTDAET